MINTTKKVIWLCDNASDNISSVEYKLRKFTETHDIEIKELDKDEHTYSEADFNFLFVNVIHFGNDLYFPGGEASLLKHIKGDFIQRHKNIGIVCWYASEADRYWERRSKEFLENLKDHKIFYISGNLNANILYESISHPYEKVYPLNYFENAINKQKVVVSSFNQIKNSDFICLMRKSRPHRAALLLKLISYGVDKTNKISFLQTEFSTLNKDNFFQEAEKYLRQDNEVDMLQSMCYNGTDFTRSLDDITTSDLYVNNFLQEISDSAYFNLVSETWPNALFITEKTYHSICFGMPFVIWGEQGILAELKRQGYKTFDMMFDESYDLCEDPSKRLELLVKSVETFCKKTREEKDDLYKKSFSAIRHNQINYIKRQSVYEKEFGKILNDMSIRINK